MDAGNPFQPRGLSTVQLSVSSTSAQIQFSSTTITAGLDNRCCMVSNSTSVTAYVEFGATSTVTAVAPGAFATPAGSAPVLGNQQRVFVSTGTNWLAAATSSGSTVIMVTPGQGGI